MSDGKILVAGLINIETTVRIESFPVHYAPVLYPFHGVNNAVSGVGYNIAKALTKLGTAVRFLSIIGNDPMRMLVRQALAADRIPGRYVIDKIESTPQSVILYDPHGARQIHVDLKDIQDQIYPQVLYERAVRDCSTAVLCNVNFTRPFLDVARRAGLTVVTDVHAIADLDDPYNRDYMAAATVLFMSHEHLPAAPEEWARRVMDRYGTEIVVIGLGGEGALLGVRSHHFLERIPAVRTRAVVSTIGAGDALLASFVHTFHRTRDPYQAIRRAVVFASYKVGSTSAADGFLDAQDLERLYADLAS